MQTYASQLFIQVRAQIPDMSSSGGAGIGVAAGVIGAVITIILYWINLAIFGQDLITSSGVWITIIISTFLTGYIPTAMSG
jgi:hypothetical protein